MNNIPSASNVYSGSLLNANTLRGDGLEGKILAISKVKEEDVGVGEDTEKKLVLYFDGIERCLALNKTNATKIIKAYSDDYGTWIGKNIILKVKEVEYKGESVEGIRVEMPPAPTSSQFAKVTKV